MKITFLGTGSSAGTPVMTCQCRVCRSKDPRNQRLRASILVEEGDVRLLVDTGPDLRQQILRAGVLRISAVLFTHFHADHINGIDDLRAFNFAQKEIIPCFADARTARELVERFCYCFLPPDAVWAKPSLSIMEISGGLGFGPMLVTPITLLHGNLPIFGYRFNNVAYLTDLKTIPDESLVLLEDLDLLVIDCLRYEEHPTHLNVEEALLWARRIGARRTYLTHMTHDVDYAELAALLPPQVLPAHDGLVLSA